MTWKSFLARLRHYLFFRPMRTRRRPPVKRPPDRRKRSFDFEPFEDRAFMEPPVTALAAMAVGVGVGVYAVNLAVVNAAARTEPAAAPAVPESDASGELPEFAVTRVEAAAAAVVLGDAARLADGLPGDRVGGSEADRPLVEPLAAPLEGEFAPAGKRGESPLGGPLDEHL